MVKNYNLNVTEVLDPDFKKKFSRNFQFHRRDPSPVTGQNLVMLKSSLLKILVGKFGHSNLSGSVYMKKIRYQENTVFQMSQKIIKSDYSAHMSMAHIL